MTENGPAGTAAPEAAGATFSNDSDTDLLGYMAMREDDPRAAQAAGREYYRRHAKWLYQVVSKSSVARVLGGNAAGVVEDIVQDSFLRAYQRAETYQAPLDGAADEGRYAVRAWLGTIASNVALDMLAAIREQNDALAEVRAWQEAEADTTDSAGGGSPLQALCNEAVKQLSDRERDVLFTTMEFEKPGVANQRLPNLVSKQLADRLGTTPENIRALRKRAKDKVRAYIESHRPGLAPRSTKP